MKKMGKIGLLTGLSLIIVFVFASNVAAVINDPVLWWKFDEPTNAEFSDSMTETSFQVNNYGSLGALYNAWAGAHNELIDLGNNQMSLLFRKPNTNSLYQYVKPQADQQLSTGSGNEITVSFWFNSYDLTSIRRIIEHEWDSNGAFTSHTQNNFLVFNFRQNDNSVVELLENVNQNTWYHVVAVYKGTGTNKKAILYLNGNEVDLKSIINNKNLKSASKMVVVGGAVPDNRYKGLIDEVMIYNRALTDIEVSELYNSQNIAARNHLTHTNAEEYSLITARPLAVYFCDPAVAVGESVYCTSYGFNKNTIVYDFPPIFLKAYSDDLKFTGPMKSPIPYIPFGTGYLDFSENVFGEMMAAVKSGKSFTIKLTHEDDDYYRYYIKNVEIKGLNYKEHWLILDNLNYAKQMWKNMYGTNNADTEPHIGLNSKTRERGEWSTFDLVAPSEPGYYRIYFTVVASDIPFINEGCIDWGAASQTCAYDVVNFRAYYDLYVYESEAELPTPDSIPPLPSQTCADDQIILSLYNLLNSHVSSYNDANAQIPICYDELFGTPNSPLLNPHDCNGNINKIIGISQATNAHAEEPSLSNYAGKICYGDLTCSLKENSCSADEVAVVSLSSDTNAHVALGTDSTYTKKICCKTQAGVIPGTGEIISPEHRQVYFANTNLNFKYSPLESSSRVSWTIDGPNNEEITSNQKEFTRQFVSAGQRTITVKETDINGVIKNEKQIAILIINGESHGILAFVNKPIHKEYVYSDDLQVNYKADESYVISMQISNPYSCSGRTITCLAGDCPAKVKNSPPPDCDNQVPIGGSKPQPYTNVIFNWMFHGPNQKVEGQGASFIGGTQGYSSEGEYLIDYIMKYQEGGDSFSSLLFQRVFTLSGKGGCNDDTGICAVCSEDGQWLIYQKTDGTEDYRVPTSTSVTAPPACAGIDGVIGTRDDCCPIRHGCKPADGDVLAGCYPSDIEGCKDYTTQITCEAGNAWQIDETRFNVDNNGKKCGEDWANGLCVYNIVCNKCKWVPGAEEGRKCQLQRTDRPSSSNPAICNPDNNPSSICTYSLTSASNCENGFKTIEIDATLDPSSVDLGNGACVDRTITIPCGRAILAMPFFKGIQILAALLLILIIYLIIHKIKKKKKK